MLNAASVSPQGAEPVVGDPVDPLDADEYDGEREETSAPGAGPTAAEQHIASGGASRGFGALLAVLGAIGVFAAAKLAIEYINMLQDADYVPACDINPFISCGAFLGSSQAAAFGIPNVVIGMTAFPVVVATGMVLLGRVRLPLWYWRGFAAGTLFGIGFVTWLQYQSLFVFGRLCPWCLVVWTVMIPIFVNTLAQSMRTGAIPAPGGLKDFVLSYRWAIVALWYLVIIALIGIQLQDVWRSML